VLEAAHLQHDLRRTGFEPWAWNINISLAAAKAASPLLARRTAAEPAQINAVRHTHVLRVARVPLQVEEPVGVARLRAPAAQ